MEAEFVPRAQVFPGGRIDEADDSPRWDDLTEMSHAEAAALLRTEVAGGVRARAFLVGAVREVFEETGVLLGVDGKSLAEPTWLQTTRTRVHQAEETFADVLAAGGLRLRLRDLVPFARWVTPEALPKRYDTFFMAAPMPPNQEAVPARGEIASLEWVTAADALARADSKDAYTLPPTRAALAILAGYADVASALADIGQNAQLAPILPRVVSRPAGPGEQGISVLLPGEPGYEEQA